MILMTRLVIYLSIVTKTRILPANITIQTSKTSGANKITAESCETKSWNPISRLNNHAIKEGEEGHLHHGEMHCFSRTGFATLLKLLSNFVKNPDTTGVIRSIPPLIEEHLNPETP